ncbi:MAG: DUF1491 family protein [Erythrobacter sp.]|jgi:hypothetical protein|nr:DUF1491 family protein [Erythrobacter sp.]
MSARLPAHLEVAALRHLARAQGGIATVLSSGERDAGVVLLVLLSRGGNAVLYERMPQLDGTRSFTVSREQDVKKPQEFEEYLARRRNQDPDTWILEVDIDDPARFVASLPR